MLDSIMGSIYGTAESLAASVTTATFLYCTLASIVLGLVCAGVYMFRHKYSKNFVITLALLPLIVQMVITLVNGNLGAGIAVMGVQPGAVPLHPRYREGHLQRVPGYGRGPCHRHGLPGSGGALQDRKSVV